MFIILHRAEHRPIYINPRYISKMEATGAFQKMQNPEWSTVLTVDGQLTYVTETAEEVMGMITMSGFMSPIGKEILQGHPKEPPVGIFKGLETRGGEPKMTQRYKTLCVDEIIDLVYQMNTEGPSYCHRITTEDGRHYIDKRTGDTCHATIESCKSCLRAWLEEEVIIDRRPL